MSGGCAGLDPASFERERAVVIQEIAQRRPDKALRAVHRDLYGAGHRYTEELGGSDISGLTLDDACGFLASYYAPAQAILVISGRFDRAATLRTLATQFAAMPRRPAALRDPVRPLALTGGTSEHRADTDEAAVMVVFPAAPWGTAESYDDALVDRSDEVQQALRKALFWPRPSLCARPAPRAGARLDLDRRSRHVPRGHYRAPGATLIIVGQFDTAQMTRIVTELFGAWAGAAPPAVSPPPAMHPRAGPTWLAHDDPEASQIQISLAFAATSPRGARAVVATMLRSRLEEVRTRLGASYGVVSSYLTTEAGDVLAATGYVDANRAGEVVRVMQQALEGLRTGDAALAADFVRARRAVLARALAAPMMASTVADELEDTVTKHRALDAAVALPAAIAATTLAEARAVIAADLKPARMVALLDGRAADVAAAFAAAGITSVQIAGTAAAP